VDVQSPFSGFRGSLRIPGKAGPSGLERNAEQPKPEKVGPVQGWSSGETQKTRKAETNTSNNNNNNGDNYEKDVKTIYWINVIKIGAESNNVERKYIDWNIGKSWDDGRMKSWDETNAECLIIIPIFMLSFCRM